jgi:hypothetical protein
MFLRTAVSFYVDEDMGMRIRPIELGNDTLELDRFRDIELNGCRVMGAQGNL